MIVLGIDTVFHSACVSILRDDEILCSVVKKSSVSKSRRRLIDFTFSNVSVIGGLIKNALKEAKLNFNQVSLISVTNRGSLLSSVLVGVTAANTLAGIYDIPVIGVDHHEAHVYSNWLENDYKNFNFPILVFSASGAHTSLCLIGDENKGYKEIFSNKGVIDSKSKKPDFVGIGTLFSDVSLILKLRKINTAGNDGLLVSDMADKGDCLKYDFFKNYPDKESDFWNFKQIKLYIINRIKAVIKKDNNKNLISDIAASFEHFITQLVISKLERMSDKYKVKEIHLVGGVASNDFLRKRVNFEFIRRNIVVRYPKKMYCVDNAAMVANLGRMKFNKARNFNKKTVEAESDLIFDKIAIDQYFKRF